MNRQELKKLHNLQKFEYKFSNNQLVEQKNQGIFTAVNELIDSYL